MLDRVTRACHRVPGLMAYMLAGTLMGSVLASEVPLVPLPSVPDFSDGEGWGVVLGAGVEYEAGYDGSDEYELEAEPVAVVHWRGDHHLLFAEGMELGWRARTAPRWLWQAGIRYEGGLEEDDSDKGYLTGIEDRDSHVVGFVEVRHAMDDQWQSWVGARVMAGETDFGQLGVLAIGHRFGKRTDGFGTEIILFSTFGDQQFINKDFGVTADDAASSGLSETKLDSGYRSTGLTLMDRRPISDNLQLMIQAGIEQYSGDIEDSPIARDDYELEVGASVFWVL